MIETRVLQVNEVGHLTIGGRDTVELAQTYGTPLYVMDEEEIRRNCRSYRDSIHRFYAGNGLVAYACKALCCRALCQIVKEEGLGLDVVSGGELHTAASVGFPADRIYFHGNNKSVAELTQALEYGVGHIVVDNLTELELLDSLAKAAGKRAVVSLRIKPGVEAHTHEFIRTGQIDSKFGFALETEEAMEAIRVAISMDGVELRGLHCHIGSQIFDIDPFEHAAQVMLRLTAQVRAQTGHLITELNLGGGFGIQYLPQEQPAAYASYMQRVSTVVKHTCEELDIPMPYVVLEPGRSIVGPAGITLYTVGAIKEIPGVRTYLSVDGGMGDNPRYALYRSQYQALLANKANQPCTQLVTIAGKCCESGDLIGENIPVAQAASGDILAVLATGAYNYSMASNYNRNPRPAMVLVREGEARVVVRRESLEDLVRNDLL